MKKYKNTVWGSFLMLSYLKLIVCAATMGCSRVNRAKLGQWWATRLLCRQNFVGRIPFSVREMKNVVDCFTHLGYLIVRENFQGRMGFVCVATVICAATMSCSRVNRAKLGQWWAIRLLCRQNFVDRIPFSVREMKNIVDCFTHLGYLIVREKLQ